MSAQENLSGGQFPRTMRVKRPDSYLGFASERDEPTIHRGVALGMTPERAARFHATDDPAEKAKVVMEHVQGSSRNGSNNREGWDRKPY